jgi:soluble lytic murein transglycosylase-like protein
VLSKLGIPSPSRQLLEASPRLSALKTLIEDSPERELVVGADLAQLAWAQALAEVGALADATSLAEQLTQGEQSSQLGALSLLVEVAPCPQGEEALQTLKRRAQDQGLPPPWDEASLALTERSWAQRCSPNLLRKVNRRIAKRLPQLAVKLSLSLPRLSRAEDQLERALTLEAGRAYDQALTLLQELGRRPKLSRELSWRARYERARIQIERVRTKYKEAALALDALSKEPRPPSKQLWRDARLLAAKAWSKAGKARRAEAVYRDLIKRWEHSDEAKTARFMIAFSHYEAGEWRKAAKAFAPLCRHQGEAKRAQKLKGLASRSGWTRASEWYYAWSVYLRSPRSASAFLTYQIGEGLPTSEDGRRAAYWASKALEANKKLDQARALRASLLKGDPFDWYALLLRARYPDELSDLSPVQFSKVTAPPAELSDPDLTDPLKRLLFSQRLGLKSLDLLEQKRAKDHLKAKLSGLGYPERVALLSWARTAGLIELSLRMSVGLNLKLLSAPPSSTDERSWQLAYPWSYTDELHKASEHEGVAESTILSFIRKESAFQPRAQSHAHAQGLMQLLDKTAFSIATWEGAEPIPDLDPEELDLLNPKVNIQLGARYLRALSERYHGQLPLIAAGYNAGPAHLNSWLKQSSTWSARTAKGRAPLDLFVERVPFKEARLYVKRLMKTKCLYELLYGDLSINQCASTLPLTLDTSIRGGVNF